jgi:hypothetical protein
MHLFAPPSIWGFQIKYLYCPLHVSSLLPVGLPRVFERGKGEARRAIARGPRSSRFVCRGCGLGVRGPACLGQRRLDSAYM